MARRNAPGPKPPSLGFAYSAPHAEPGGGDESPLDIELAQLVRDQRKLLMAQRLAPGAFVSTQSQGSAVAVPSAGPTVIPQPASLGDAVNAASGISQIHREAAQTAMETAEMERERRQEAEMSVGEAAQSARQDEANRWSAINDMTSALRAEISSIREESHQAQLAAKDSQAAQIATQMKADADRMVAALQAEKDRLAAEVAQKNSQIAVLSQRPTMEQMAFEVMSNPNDPRFAVFQKVYGQVSQGDSFDEWWRKENAKRHLNRQDNEERRKEEKHGQSLRLMRNLNALAREGRERLPAMLAGAPRGIDQNGVSSAFGDDEPPQEAMPQDTGGDGYDG